MADLHKKMQDDMAAVQTRAKAAHEMHLKAVNALDSQTKVGHLMIQLNNDKFERAPPAKPALGTVEINGKDIGGIYAKLDEFLKSTWPSLAPVNERHDLWIKENKCCGSVAGREFKWQTLGETDYRDIDKLCGAHYMHAQEPLSEAIMFIQRGKEGENNMGRLGMKFVDFMANTCGWGLQAYNGNNLGYYGQIRELQLKFHAPHPLNILAPHLLIELRGVGYVEMTGPDADGIYGKFGTWATEWLSCTADTADPLICDAKFKCKAFHRRGNEFENNMSQVTVKVLNFMAECGWTSITCDTGNFGSTGDKREQLLVFRKDPHVKEVKKHLIVDVRTIGYVEINGIVAAGAEGFDTELENFLRKDWKCETFVPGRMVSAGGKQVEYCEKKFVLGKKTEDGTGVFVDEKHSGNNLGLLVIQLTTFAARHGWELLLSNCGDVKADPIMDIWPLHEQQIKLVKASPGVVPEPLLMIEVRLLPPFFTITGEELFVVEMNGDDNFGVYRKLHAFFTGYLAGTMKKVNHCKVQYMCSGGRAQGLRGATNLGRWVMRIIDFMVDHVGEWDLIQCTGGNREFEAFYLRDDNEAVPTASSIEKKAICLREMNMIFRHKSESAQAAPPVLMPPPQQVSMALGRAPARVPPFWKPATRDGQAAHEVVPGGPDELAWMQQLLDRTFFQKPTRDRSGKLADSFEVVACMRSENPALWDKYATRHDGVLKKIQARGGWPSEVAPVKTLRACSALHERAGAPCDSEAYLFHGTSPSSALSLLAMSFQMDLSGQRMGNMFGPGGYLAEECSKADEYASDDQTGTYKGLFSLVVCRASLGKPFVSETGGDFSGKVSSGDFDFVIGDREKASGTYREFVFSDESALYPEYVVIYKRVFQDPAAAAGQDLGRKWVFDAGESEMKPMPANISSGIEKAYNKGAVTYKYELSEGKVYEIDFESSTQRNVRSGRERQIGCQATV